MSIRTGIIIAITLKQVDSTPDAKTGTESHNQSLQYANCAVEKSHIALLISSPYGVVLILSDTFSLLRYPLSLCLYRLWVLDTVTRQHAARIYI